MARRTALRASAQQALMASYSVQPRRPSLGASSTDPPPLALPPSTCRPVGAVSCGGALLRLSCTVTLWMAACVPSTAGGFDDPPTMLQNVAAKFSGDDELLVSRLMMKLYGAEVTKCIRLNSYDDLNFYIAVQQPSASSLRQCAYVLKIMHAGYDVTSVRAQTKLLLHVVNQGVCVPTPVKNLDGHYWSQETAVPGDNSGGARIVRLLTYIPGRLLGSSPVAAPLLRQAGSYLALFHSAAKRVSDEGFNRSDFIWALGYVPKLTNHLEAVPDLTRRRLAKEVIESWDCVERLYPSFSKGILHGDPNEMNILVSEGVATADECVCGLIDFGDVHSGYLVFDVAMLIAYMLMYSDVDQLDVGAQVLAGYSAVAPLNTQELDALFYAVAGRLTQSVVLGLYTFALTQNPYVLNTQVPGWRALGRLWTLGKQAVQEGWLAGVYRLQNNAEQIDSSK